MNFSDYRMERRSRKELTTGLVLYGENEPAEMQIDNLWKIVDRKTGEELADPKGDFSEFSTGDRMYPSMMKPEVKRRWDQKNYEWEETKAMHAKLRRMVHAQFMQENPNLPVVQGLKQTTYGNEVQTEFKKHVNNHGDRLKPQASQSRTPQTGTGDTIRDEMQRDNVDINEIADEALRFLTPETEETYAVIAVNRDENLRIEDKVLISAESSHVLEYRYDEDGRLQAASYCAEPVEVYRYNKLGQRVFSQVAGGDKLEYSYNDLGQLVRAGDTIYVYDQDGDLSEKHSFEGCTRYEYLKAGQLCEVHLPDGTAIEYRFDERGFRTEKYINGQLIQRYQWNDLTTLAAVEDAEGISKFHYNEHGRAMGMIRNGQVFLFATDQLGSVFTIADPSGNSVQEVLYDSFGKRIQNSNPEHDLALGFCGGLHDSDTGLTHFGYREYDPFIGRFISPDPLGYDGGDVDVYGYCLDDPINFVDRKGLFGNGLCGAFGSGKTDTRAHSSLGANRSTSKETSHNSSKKGSRHSSERNGTIGAFGSGNIHGRAHSTLGFNGNRTIGKNNTPSANTGSGTSGSSRNELGGYTNYTGYAGPSFEEYLGKNFAQKSSRLTNTSDLWGGKTNTKATAKQERRSKIQRRVSRGSMELKNNTSPLTETVDRAQQAKASMPDKTEGGVGTSTITGKSSAQQAPELGSPSKVTVDKTQQNKDQHIAIGKFAVRRSLLAQTVDKDQQDKESGTWNGMLRTARGIGTAVSRFADVFDAQGNDVINYGPYVSNETKEIANKMAREAHKAGKKSARGGIKKFGPAGLLTYPVGAAYGAADYMFRGPVFDSVKEQMQSKNSN